LFGENGREGGSLSSFNTERCRVLPKRHNPDIGITLRSISSNLAFHQSSVDIVWRKTRGNTLGDKLKRDPRNPKNPELSILLLPFPLTINAKDFSEDEPGHNVVNMPPDQYKFFAYKAHAKDGDEGQNNHQVKRAMDLVTCANQELAEVFNVDIVVLPEAALSLNEFENLQEGLRQRFKELAPSIMIAGVRESKDELAAKMTNLGRPRASKHFNFARNAVYCQYYNKQNGGEIGSYYNEPQSQSPTITPKYKQYKHHRWQLDRTQIRRYGLSSILSPNLTWWESIKIPKRRVSFLNVGDRMTISHLICEDLARQDPIAELVRQVGPTLVVSILMDGPQLKNRWSARYATVLSDDPGSSVITLTSLGMVKRHISEYGAMSRVVALWNESGGGHSREIELAQGAEAVLLTLRMDETPEKTADGRQEHVPTSILRLNDVIQIYPPETAKQPQEDEDL
jgi:predicted amidohydrolase